MALGQAGANLRVAAQLQAQTEHCLACSQVSSTRLHRQLTACAPPAPAAWELTTEQKIRTQELAAAVDLQIAPAVALAVDRARCGRIRQGERGPGAGVRSERQSWRRGGPQAPPAAHGMLPAAPARPPSSSRIWAARSAARWPSDVAATST